MKINTSNKKRIILGLFLICTFTISYGQIGSPYNIGYNVPDSIYKPSGIYEVLRNPDNYESTDEITYYKYNKGYTFNIPGLPPVVTRPSISKTICFFDTNKKCQHSERYGYDHDTETYLFSGETFYEYNDSGKRTYTYSESFIDEEEQVYNGTTDVTYKEGYDENGHLIIETRERNYTVDPSDYDTIRYEYSYDEVQDLIIQKQLFLNRSFPKSLYVVYINDTVINHTYDELDSIKNVILGDRDHVLFDSLEYITKIKTTENKDTIITTSYVPDTISIEEEYNLHAQNMHCYYNNNNDTIVITDFLWTIGMNGKLNTYPMYKKTRIYKNEKLVYSIRENRGSYTSTNCSSGDCTTKIGLEILKDEMVYFYDNDGLWESAIGTQTHIESGEETSSVEYYCKALPDSILGRSSTTPINNTKTNSLSVYPNPVTDVVTIEMQQTINSGELLITNIAGKLIEQLPVNMQSEITIDVSQYEKGMYFISLKGESGIYTKRIVKY